MKKEEEVTLNCWIVTGPVKPGMFFSRYGTSLSRGREDRTEPSSCPTFFDCGFEEDIPVEMVRSLAQ